MTNMVMVPREPTEAMLAAGDSAIPRAEADNSGVRMMGREVCLEAWSAMIAAAPPPQLPDDWRFKPSLLWPENGWRWQRRRS